MTADENELERAGAFTIELLRLCNESTHLSELLDGMARCLQQLVGCEAVGIRLRKGDDFPYFETRGFPREFVKDENRLCVADADGQVRRDERGRPRLRCACGIVLHGGDCPPASSLSPGGSFWVNSVSAMQAGVRADGADSGIQRRCSEEGYESIALIPLRCRGDIIGLVHCVDRRKGLFTEDRIALLEHLGGYASIALAKMQAEESMRETLQRMRLATAAGKLAVWDWDISDNTLSWDRPGSDILGVSPEVHAAPVAKWRASIHPDDRARVDEVFRNALKIETPVDVTCRVARPDGTWRDVHILGDIIRDGAGKPVRISGVVHDITESLRIERRLRESEGQLRQAQKLESVGRLAGGVAHDFNNLLTPILAYSEMLQSDFPPGDPRREGLQEIHRAGIRARDLTRQLLAFGRRQILDLEPVDMRDVVRGFEKLLRHTLREDIRIDVSLPPALSIVRADIGQMEQVILNLAVNGQDAMPRGGLLSLELADVLVDEAAVTGIAGATPGRYVLLAVTDNGCGMDAATLEHLFEPFFTTKGKGKGSGLGLCTSYGIVRQHGGFMRVESRPEQGSTFRIYLPAALDEATARPVAPPTEGSLPRGRETVLIAEDNDIVRQMTAEILRSLGYSVLVAKGADHCRAAMYGRPGPIDLLLTDVVMPGMNGRQLYEYLQTYQPGLKVLYMSGYAGDIIADRGVLQRGTCFIQKPFSALQLATKIREALGG